MQSIILKSIASRKTPILSFKKGRYIGTKETIELACRVEPNREAGGGFYDLVML